MKNRAEKFTGLTMAIHPVFNLIGIILLSIKKSQLITKIKSDRISLYFWMLLAASGVISIIVSIDKPLAIASFLAPFIFIWLYILGRWVIKDPAAFVQNLIRGAAILALSLIIAKIFHLNWQIGSVKILSAAKRGMFLEIRDNGLAVLIQTGVVGALGSIFIYWKGKKYVLENIFSFLICAYGLTITESRGAMIGIMVSMVFMFALLGWKALVGAGTAVGIFAFFSSRFFSSFNIKEHSSYLRLIIWKSSLQIVKDHPLFGVGPGNFVSIYEKYKPAQFKASNYNVTCAHSNYLSFIIGWGIIGGILFWGWQLFVIIRAAIKGLTPLQKIILAILISFYAHVTVNDLFATYWGFILGLMDHPSFQKKAENI